VDLLFGDGEGLCRDVSNDPGFLTVRSVGEHRKSIRAGDTPLLYDRHIGDLQHSVIVIGLLEVPNGCHVFECVFAMEGTNGEFRRGIATRTRSVKSLQEGDP